MPIGTITALRAQANDTQRVNVFIDEEFAIGVSLNTLAREHLFVGKIIDEAGWERLESVELSDKALQAGMRLIELRPRSIAELRQRLRRKEFPPAAIDQAVERLSDLGLLDDAAFSRFWVESRRTFRPRGSIALRDELRRKGVAQDAIEAAIIGEADQADIRAEEQAQAIEIARKALRRYADSPDRMSFQRRMGAFLQRRGFTIDTIRPIVHDLWSELQAAKELPSDDDDMVDD